MNQKIQKIFILSYLIILASIFNYRINETPNQVQEFANEEVLEPKIEPLHLERLCSRNEIDTELINKSKEEKIEEIKPIEKSDSEKLQECLSTIEYLKNPGTFFEWYVEYKSIYAKFHSIKRKNLHDYYTEDELNLLFGVVNAEIGDYSFEQICNVASVVFNRIEHAAFGNDIYSVLIPGQFATIDNGTYLNPPYEKTILACEFVFEFGDTTNGCLFFDSNGVLNYNFIFNDGAHNFYKLYE